MIHCFQFCFWSQFQSAKKKETQYGMFFLRNNSLLTWLGNNYTNPLQEAGVFMTLYMIHLRSDFYFNFCHYGVHIVFFSSSVFLFSFF